MDSISHHIGQITSRSSVYETEPWGLEGQPNFLNMVISVLSKLSPMEVFEKNKSIEKQAGVEKTVKWGPRILDIDILYCDDIILETDLLTIPHKQIYNRNFTLIPLMEIAGDMTDPVKKLTIDELYDQCLDEKEVFLFEE
jgi:2-amino-4-hydroxy-6-hydroxymethyldihydropteridine diphosphokinase